LILPTLVTVMVQEISADNFEEEVKQSDKPVVVDFWADWCGPCKMLSPVFEKVAAELEGDAKFVKLNVDEAQEIAQANNVQSIPTLVIFREGNEKARLQGFMSEDQLKERIQELLR